MNMLNKCAKFHKDSPSDKKINSISRERLNYRRRPFLCTPLYRNLMQASNFGVTFDQLFLCICLWKFHRRCVSTYSIPWCKKVKNDQKLKSRGSCLKGGIPDLSFWSCLTFLHHGVEIIEGHLLWKLRKKIQKKSSSNMPPKLLAWFLYKVVHKIGCLWKFNRSRKIEFNFLAAWTISMKFGTLVQHAHCYKTFPQVFHFWQGT